MTSPFADLAARQIAAPVKRRRSRAQERALKKVVIEKSYLTKAWRRWRAESRETLLAGRHGAAARELFDFLSPAGLQSASETRKAQSRINHDELIALVRRGRWHQADADTRFLVLSIIDAALIRQREAQELEPFDDPLPDCAAPHTFITIHGLLT